MLLENYTVQINSDKFPSEASPRRLVYWFMHRRTNLISRIAIASLKRERIEKP